MRPLGVAHLTAIELAPDAFIREAGRAGFSSVGLRVNPAMAGGVAFPTTVGTREHEERRKILAGEGVALHDIEFIQLTPDVEVASFAPMLEAGADLGAVSVTVSGDDADEGRLTANFAALCDLAAGYGLRVDLEFMRWRVIGHLQAATALVTAAGRPNGAILLDALHLDRSGGDPSAVRALPTGLVRAVQICDAPTERPMTDEETIAEARGGRLPPGEGALPLAAILAALPTDAEIGVEMPFPSLDAPERLARAFRSAQTLLRAGR